MQFNCKMGYSGNEQDYQLVKTSLSELKKYSNQKEVLRYLTNVLPNPTDVVTLDNAQNTVKSVKAQLANKNLIPYPYAGTSKIISGVTFTVNSDGSVTTNGTATANIVFELESDTTMFTLPVGNYFLSGCPNGGSLTSYFMAAVNGAGASYDKFLRDFGNGISVPSKGEKWKITIRIISGYTADNLVFKPQIELGSTATAYTPYISDFSTVNVTRCGKNLFDKSIPISNYISLDTSYKYLKYYVGIGTNVTVSIAEKPTVPNNNGFIYVYPSATPKPDGNAKWLAHQTVNALCSQQQTVVSTDGYVCLVVSVNRALDYYGNSIQIELGSTATAYEPYQGQTYTPTATGEVTGITVLTPTTNIINDKGLLFTKVIGDDFNYIN